MSPDVNFKDVPDAVDFPVVPTGEYDCIVEKVTPGLSKVDEETGKGGNDLWKLELTITDGEFATSKLFDNLVFIPGNACMSRIKCLFAAIGRDTSADEIVTLMPEMVQGRELRVAVTTGPHTYKGETKDKSVVNFAGYGKVGVPMTEGEAPKDDIGNPGF